MLGTVASSALSKRRLMTLLASSGGAFALSSCAGTYGKDGDATAADPVTLAEAAEVVRSDTGLGMMILLRYDGTIVGYPIVDSEVGSEIIIDRWKQGADAPRPVGEVLAEDSIDIIIHTGRSDYIRCKHGGEWIEICRKG